METVRQFSKAILSKITSAEQEGDTLVINEIAANLFVATMMIVMAFNTLICLVLNDLGIFSADRYSMANAAIFSCLAAVPGLLLTKIYRGSPSWLKYVLGFSILLQVGAVNSILGHNVVLATVIPVVLSIRYFDEKYTWVITIGSFFFFLGSAIASAYIGISNLNAIKPAVGTVITVETNIRDALNSTVSTSDYVKSLLINDFLPRLMIFLVIAVICHKIALRSRQFVELQDKVSKKSSRIETELNLATSIQNGMLPKLYPAFPEYDGLDISALNRPAKEVGGDFYDYFRVDENHIAVVIADVSGKGVGAALFMMIAKTLIKNYVQSCPSVSEAITKANNQLCENNVAEMFVTAWVGVYDVPSGTLCYTNAGHNPPCLYRVGGSFTYLTDRHGLVLGAMGGINYKSSELTLSHGDRLILYTDGVTEAVNPKNELYGEDRLLAFLNSHKELSAPELIRAVLKDIDTFADGADQFDDITLLGMDILDS